MAVTRRGRDGKCIRHSDRPAVARCSACHRPVCIMCVVSTADGKFCSRQCAARTADFRKEAKTSKNRGMLIMQSSSRLIGALRGPAKMAAGLILLIALLCVVNRYFCKVPVIGDYLWSATKVELPQGVASDNGD